MLYLEERKKVVIVGIPGVGKTSLVTKVVELIKEKNKTSSVHSYGTEMLEQAKNIGVKDRDEPRTCLLYTSPSPRDLSTCRMPSSA